MIDLSDWMIPVTRVDDIGDTGDITTTRLRRPDRVAVRVRLGGSATEAVVGAGQADILAWRMLSTTAAADILRLIWFAKGAEVIDTDTATALASIEQRMHRAGWPDWPAAGHALPTKEDPAPIATDAAVERVDARHGGRVGGPHAPGHLFRLAEDEYRALELICDWITENLHPNHRIVDAVAQLADLRASERR